jgi:hypothetical protein
MRIKVTGYFTPEPDEPDEVDTDDPTGLTSEAYETLSDSLQLSDLEEVTFEVDYDDEEGI